MKTCITCKITKPLSEYNKKGKGLQPVCRSCNSLMLKKHYQKNKKVYKKRQSEREAEAKEFILQVRSTSKCEKCGESHVAVLDFHHNRDKEVDISLAAYKGWSIRRIKKEMDKCSILCANCHRKLHWEEKHTPVV